MVALYCIPVYIAYIVCGKTRFKPNTSMDQQNKYRFYVQQYALFRVCNSRIVTNSFTQNITTHVRKVYSCSY